MKNKHFLPAPERLQNLFKDLIFLSAGALVQALSMRMFLVPGLMVSGGISGAAQIINHFTRFPIGAMVVLGNIPLYLLGWRYLGGRRFALRTALSILLFALLTDLLVVFIPPSGITADLVLNALYGGVTLGIGLGLVYKGGVTSGGSDILARILNHYRGLSVSQAYLLTDAAVVLASGFAFGWDRALYGLIVIYVSGFAAELVSEGSGIFRMALIVTNKPQEIATGIFDLLERGVTILPGTGGWTGEKRPVLYCVLTRAEINVLKSIVSEVDPKALMVIGQAHEALGEGFRALRKPNP